MVEETHLERSRTDRIAKVLHPLVLENLANHVHGRLLKSLEPVLLARLSSGSLLLLVPAKVGARRDGSRARELLQTTLRLGRRLGVVRTATKVLVRRDAWQRGSARESVSRGPDSGGFAETHPSGW